VALALDLGERPAVWLGCCRAACPAASGVGS